MTGTPIPTTHAGAAHETRALEILHAVYGYHAFRGQQAEIIAAVCAGRDALVLMPTGGGKSLCYQIPAIVRTGVGIVVSPLIALMQDQVRALRLAGVRAEFLNSTLTPDAQAEVMRATRNNELDLLYLAPERLLKADTLAELAACRISLIAIDEAHCISAWGHDFRQEYRQLDQLGERFPGVPRVALTATADERTREDIVERLALRDPARFIDSFDRANICYSVQPKTDQRRQLLEFLAERRDEAGIVYCLSRNSVDTTAGWLRDQGYDALAYHAGMDARTRMAHQTRFLEEDGLIMVATIAFGMGIDKPDVRFVAHLDLPKSIEAYYQETGRAGRDGAPAEAWMIYGLQDVVRLSRMADESAADAPQKRIERAKLDALLGWCELTTCRRQALLRYFGEDAPSSCGNCDVCLRPPLTWDGTQAAQKALSCVYRTGQRFGAGHVIDVLRGSTNEKVTKFGHDRLTTFGIGAESSEAQWRSVFRQLVVRGLLAIDHERFGALRLTEASRAVLRGDLQLPLRTEPQASRRRRTAAAGVDPADAGLFSALKQLRKNLADAEGVPPYVIFHDATLMDMLARRPVDAAGLLEVSGVGRSKLQKYGDAFLEVLAADR